MSVNPSPKTYTSFKTTVWLILYDGFFMRCFCASKMLLSSSWHAQSLCVQELAEINNILKQVFLILPHYCLGRGLIDMASYQLQADLVSRYGKSSFHHGETTALGCLMFWFRRKWRDWWWLRWLFVMHWKSLCTLCWWCRMWEINNRPQRNKIAHTNTERTQQKDRRDVEMEHIHWWEEMAAAIKPVKLYSFECRNQTDFTVNSACQDSTI